MLASISAAVCAFLLISGLITALIPDKRLENGVRLIITASFILLTAELLGGFEPTVSKTSYEATVSYPCYATDAAVLALSERKAESALNAALKNIGLSAESIAVDMDIYEDEGIRITRVEFTGDGSDTEEVAKYLTLLTGCEAVEEVKRE